jgi:hypothetical protein
MGFLLRPRFAIRFPAVGNLPPLPVNAATWKKPAAVAGFCAFKALRGSVAGTGAGTTGQAGNLA